MATTGLDVFDKSLQTTNIWLDEVMAEIGPDRQVAWHVLGTVLRALRDRVPKELFDPFCVAAAAYHSGRVFRSVPCSSGAFEASHAGGVLLLCAGRIARHSSGRPTGRCDCRFQRRQPSCATRSKREDAGGPAGRGSSAVERR
jgi:hypothetical protein